MQYKKSACLSLQVNNVYMFVIVLPSSLPNNLPQQQAVDCTLVTPTTLPKQLAALLESSAAEHRVINEKDLQRRVWSNSQEMCRLWLFSLGKF